MLTMKKATILFFSLVLATTTFCQQEAREATVTHVDFLKKSKKQKTYAWLLTGAGSAILVLNALVSPYTNAITDIAGTHSVNTIFYVGGAALVAGGVILFVASSKNKKKAGAVSVFLSIEEITVYQNTTVTNRSLPAFGFRISL
jgi:hypothetical protein